MSSPLRHVSQGSAGLTGAPRPALVTAAGGVSDREQDIKMATNSATNAARPLLATGVCDIGADHTFESRCVTITQLEEIHVRAALTLTCLVIWSVATLAQTKPAPGTQKPGMTPRPPLLFSEPWKLPPYTGEQTDENMRFTPAVVTNPGIEVKLYGSDAKVIRAAVHEERFDLWNGMTTSPTAITLRDRKNFVDLTDAARLRWILRTNAIHALHPVVRLADGRLIVGDRTIVTDGEFLTVEIAFSGMRWYGLDPNKVIVLTEVINPDLRRVDEVGQAMLAPGGGHGIAGSANLSNVELFAYPVPR